MMQAVRLGGPAVVGQGGGGGFSTTIAPAFPQVVSFERFIPWYWKPRTSRQFVGPLFEMIEFLSTTVGIGPGAPTAPIPGALELKATVLL